MIYAIMCGGDYPEFEEPKQLTVVNGERLVQRTIRLLKEAGVSASDICITSNNPVFDCFGVERIEDPRNDYIHGTNKLWLNPFVICMGTCFIHKTQLIPLLVVIFRETFYLVQA